MEIGVLPLPQDLVSQGLDARALTLLCPPPLGSPLSISFLPFESEAGNVFVLLNSLHTVDGCIYVEGRLSERRPTNASTNEVLTIL